MNSKLLSIVTGVIGLASLAAGAFVPSVSHFFALHASASLIFFGILKILNTFNSSTPTS